VLRTGGRVTKLLLCIPYSGTAVNVEDTKHLPIIQQNAEHNPSEVTGNGFFLNTARFKHIKPRFCVPERRRHKPKIPKQKLSSHNNKKDIKNKYL
jgi:hypothetical protein